MRLILFGIVFLIFLGLTLEQKAKRRASPINGDTFDKESSPHSIYKIDSASDRGLFDSYLKGFKDTVSKGAGMVGEGLSQVMGNKTEEARGMFGTQVFPDLRKRIEAFGNKLESVYNSLGEFDGEVGSFTSIDDYINKIVEEELENAQNAEGFSTKLKNWFYTLYEKTMNFNLPFSNLFGFDEVTLLLFKNLPDLLKELSELLRTIVSIVETMFLVICGWLLVHLIVYVLNISNSLILILSSLFSVLTRLLSKKNKAKKSMVGASPPADEPVVKFTKGEFDIRSVSLSLQKVTDDISSSHFLKFNLYYEISHFPTLKGDIFDDGEIH